MDAASLLSAAEVAVDGKVDGACPLVDVDRFLALPAALCPPE
jgi:hypothetical protein